MRNVMSKVLKWSVALILLAGFWFIFIRQPPEHPAEYYIQREIGIPLPTSMRHVKTLQKFAPGFGEGRCVAAYTISKSDLALILAANPWRAREARGEDERAEVAGFFRKAWPQLPVDFDCFELRVNELRSVRIFADKEQSRIVMVADL